MRHISGTPTEIALRLRQEVHEEVGLAITVGLACTKFLHITKIIVAERAGIVFQPLDEFMVLGCPPKVGPPEMEVPR